MKISVLTPSIRPEGLKITQEGLARQSFKDFEWLQEVSIPGNGHDLNAAYNRMLRRARGELIVSLQDFIKIPEDYLQKFWDCYQEHPRAFITAPVGKVDNLDYTPPAKWDWRAYADVTRPKWDCWEIDSGAAPLEALKAIGGFDEVLDQWWSFDNVSVGKRAELAGYEFFNLFNNPSIAYDHDVFIKHPFRGNERPLKVKLRMEQYEEPGFDLPFI